MEISQVKVIKSIDEFLNRSDAHYFYLIDSVHKNLIKTHDQNVIFIDSPEQNKNLTFAQDLIEKLLSMNIDKNSVLVAIGGGALSDIVGFISSILFRSIRYEVLPTTLLAMIDASVGGKNALNTKFSKNTLGTIYLPKTIFYYWDFLKTLPSVEILSAKGEIIKYCLLNEGIAKTLDFDLHDLVLKCVDYKHQIIQEDLLDQNKRMLLNLGHTIGHAFEHELKIPHGIAVYLGIYFEIKYFSKEKLNSFQEYSQKLQMEKPENYLKKMNLDNILKTIKLDKKSINKEINMPIWRGSEFIIESVAISTLEKKLIEDEELKPFFG